MTSTVAEATMDGVKKKVAQGGRRRISSSAFGVWLEGAGLDRAEAARQLHIARSYCDKLARGAAVPTTLLMWDIHVLTNGAVSLREWAPVARKLAQSK